MREFNFDGIVGPTHHYAGLSHGNMASQANAMSPANPQLAALQGIEKMRVLAGRGFAQGVLLPHFRPNLTLLRELGFNGPDAVMLGKAWQAAPEIVAKCYSASSMWTANAATVTPSPDSADGRVHFTPANLQAMFHRSMEHPFTERLLRHIFADEQHFAVHAALPSVDYFGDEGAANHTRLAVEEEAEGVQVFVYGRSALQSGPAPQNYPARQTLEASQAIARRHGVAADRSLFVQQNPGVIDAGVFHNDVIAVGSNNVLFYHQDAFVGGDAAIEEMRAAFGDQDFYPIKVPREIIDVQRAVNTYLFNSQLIARETVGRPSLLLVAPGECERDTVVADYLNMLVESEAPIDEVLYFDLRESMRNGGGPACLRLRVSLTDEQAGAITAPVLGDRLGFEALENWVKTHYRDRLTFDDLRDPQLLEECRRAYSELEQLFELPRLYPL
ncbi:MAG: N-succinylarginine dihydrolase [Pseudomonadota bacterium]